MTLEELEPWLRLANTMGTWLTLLFIVWIWHGNRSTNRFLQRREYRDRIEAASRLREEMGRGKPHPDN